MKKKTLKWIFFENQIEGGDAEKSEKKQSKGFRFHMLLEPNAWREFH